MPTAQPDTQQLALAAGPLGFSLSQGQLEQLACYMQLLVRWNRSMNLVGPGTWQQVFSTLVVDSLHLAAFMPRLGLPPQPVCWDLGAGAGLPGIPLRALWQEGEYVLVEAREKRALFLATVLGACELPQTRVARMRAETFFAQQPCKANCVISRAFMPLPQLLPFVEPHLDAQGFVLVLANEQLAPQTHSGWHNVEQASYVVAGKTRSLNALHRIT